MTMKATLLILVLVLVAWLGAGPLLAQRNLKDIPDPSPALQESSFQLAEGFEINLYASDPMIAKPVQINFDAQGRLWLVSSKLYPQIKPGQEADDEILVLEDRDGDGVADKKTVFADGLLIPTGVLPVADGAYVANSTEVLFMRDTDGDGRADERKAVLSGFGTEDTHHIIHTFRGGPEGMMYMNQSIYIHSHVETPFGVRRLLGGGMWHMRPDTRELEVFSRGFVNTWGHAFDRWGQSFATDGAYGEGVNYVFPGSVFVTAVNAKRFVKGLSPGQPKHCGLTILDGRHLPREWRGQYLTNDFRGHRINRFALSEQGSGYGARQLEDLVRTSHAAFRPIGVEMGPDGAIYVADWYNPIIQHGEVDFRDERRDRKHGRIWRITARGRPTLKWPQIVGAPTNALLDLLKAPEQLTRHHAKQELRSRPTRKVRQAVKDWLAGLDTAHADYEHWRLEAVWLLQGMNVLDQDLLHAVLKSPDHHARAAAVRVLYHWHDRVSYSHALLELAIADPHAQVRLEAVNALRMVGTQEAFLLAMKALDQPMDEFLDFALWLTARELEPQWLPAFQAKEFTLKTESLHFALRAVENPTALQPLIDAYQSGQLEAVNERSTVRLVTDLGSPQLLGSIARHALKHPDLSNTQREFAFKAVIDASRQRKLVPKGDLSAIVEALQVDDVTMKALACEAAGQWKVASTQPTLEQIATDPISVPVVFAGAIRGLRLLGGTDAVLFALADSEQPVQRRLAVISEMAQMDLPAAAERAAAVLGSLQGTQDGVGDLFSAFLALSKGPDALATALKGKTLVQPIAYQGVQSANASGNKPEALVKALTEAGKLKPINQGLSAEDMQALVAEVRAKGDPHRGEVVYRRQALQCAVCHALGGAGGMVGPDLVSLGASAPVDYIIESLLNPGAKIKEGYHMTVLHGKDGQVHSGFLAREGERQYVLRDALGNESSLAKDQISKREVVPVSMMPPGLTASLRRDEFVDLTRFLSELGKEGAFKIAPRRLVRRWQVLDFNDAVKENVRQGDRRFYAEPDALKTWLPAYSQVDGSLPVAEIPSSRRWLLPVAPVQCHLDVSTPGKVILKLNAGKGIQAWVGVEPLEVAPHGTLTLSLGSGRHTITLVVDPDVFPHPNLSAELVDVVESHAVVQVVGGR